MSPPRIFSPEWFQSVSVHSSRLRFKGAETPARMSMGDMFPTYTMQDITDAVDVRFYPPFPKGKQVVKASSCLVGGQGSGKSV